MRVTRSENEMSPSIGRGRAPIPGCVLSRSVYHFRNGESGLTRQRTRNTRRTTRWSALLGVDFLRPEGGGAATSDERSNTVVRRSELVEERWRDQGTLTQWRDFRATSFPERTRVLVLLTGDGKINPSSKTLSPLYWSLVFIIFVEAPMGIV